MRYGPGLVWMFAAALLLLAASSRADDIVAIYTAYWAGLPAGEIQIRLHDGAAAYHDEIEIRTTGLPALITRLRGTGIAEGRLVADRPAAVGAPLDTVGGLVGLFRDHRPDPAAVHPCSCRGRARARRGAARRRGLVDPP